MADVTVSNSRLGPAMIWAGLGTVSFPAAALGGSDGGMNATVATADADHKFDQLGTSAVDETRVGFEADIDAKLAEVVLDHMVTDFPGDAITGTTPNRTLKLNGRIGQQALRDGVTKRYTLIPQIAPESYTTNSEEVVVIPVGYAMGNMALPYGVTTHRTFEMKIKALPDTADSNNRITFGLGAAISTFIRA